MKKLIYTLLALTTVFTFTAQNTVAEETSNPGIPSWAHKEIDKVAVAAPDITIEQRVKIFKAIETRAKAVKAAKESGVTGDDLKEKTKGAWSTYINSMKEILSDEQFTLYNEKRLNKG